MQFDNSIVAMEALSPGLGGMVLHDCRVYPPGVTELTASAVELFGTHYRVFNETGVEVWNSLFHGNRARLGFGSRRVLAIVATSPVVVRTPLDAVDAPAFVLGYYAEVVNDSGRRGHVLLDIEDGRPLVEVGRNYTVLPVECDRLPMYGALDATTRVLSATPGAIAEDATDVQSFTETHGPVIISGAGDLGAVDPFAILVLKCYQGAADGEDLECTFAIVGAGCGFFRFRIGLSGLPNFARISATAREGDIDLDYLTVDAVDDGLPCIDTAAALTHLRDFTKFRGEEWWNVDLKGGVSWRK